VQTLNTALTVTGDAAKFEDALGLPANTLANNPLQLLEFPRPRDLKLALSDGTRAGANSQWMPGGYRHIQALSIMLSCKLRVRSNFIMGT
jgi:hypothetical protein